MLVIGMLQDPHHILAMAESYRIPHLLEPIAQPVRITRGMEHDLRYTRLNPRFDSQLVCQGILKLTLGQVVLGHVRGMFGTRLGHGWRMLEHVWDMLGHVWDMIESCLGHCFGRVWDTFGMFCHVSEMIRTYLGHALDMFGACGGHGSDMLSRCP